MHSRYSFTCSQSDISKMTVPNPTLYFCPFLLFIYLTIQVLNQSFIFILLYNLRLQSPQCVCCCAFSAEWVAQGSYLESNRDECTVSLIYTVHLKKLGSVSFDYQYVDNSIFFEFFVSLDPILALKYFCARYFKTSKAAILYCTNQIFF